MRTLRRAQAARVHMDGNQYAHTTRDDDLPNVMREICAHVRAPRSFMRLSGMCVLQCECRECCTYTYGGNGSTDSLPASHLHIIHKSFRKRERCPARHWELACEIHADDRTRAQNKCARRQVRVERDIDSRRTATHRCIAAVVFRRSFVDATIFRFCCPGTPPPSPDQAYGISKRLV